MDADRNTIGRADLLDTIRHALSPGSVVTLVGPGGIGKTHLAAVLAREHAAELVSLEAVAQADDALSVLASAYNLRAPSDLLERLGQFMVDAPLVVLDNLEHLVDSLSEAVTQWCEQGARVLVTSRRPLRIESEVVIEVPPLDDVRDATRLFQLRAPRDRTLDPDDVLEVVQRVGGNPLALELVASRLRVLTLDGLLDRIQDWTLWSENRPDRPERHRSVQQAVRWSWELLSDDSRAVLSGLAVFPGRFTLKTAELLLGRDLLEASLELVDSSILRRHDDGALSLFPGAREVVRTLVDPSSWRAAHTRLFADQVRGRIMPAMLRRDTEFLNGLAPIRPDLLHAAQHALEVGDPDLVGPLVSALAMTGCHTGPIDPEVTRTESALACVHGQARQSMLWVHARCLQFAGRMADASEALREGAAIAGDYTALSTIDLGAILLLAGQVDEGVGMLQALSTQEIPPSETALLSERLALASLFRGDLEGAAQHATEAEMAWSALGAHTRAQDAAIQRGRALMGLGRSNEAMEALGRALDDAVRHGDRVNEAEAAGILAIVAWSQLPAERTLALHEQAIDAAHGAGLPRAEFYARYNLAECLLDLERPEEARLQLDTAARFFHHSAESVQRMWEILWCRWLVAVDRTPEAQVRIDSLIDTIDPQDPGVWRTAHLERAAVLQRLGLDASGDLETARQGQVALDSLRQRLRLAALTGQPLGADRTAIRPNSIAASMAPTPIRWDPVGQILYAPGVTTALKRRGPARRILVGLLATGPGVVLSRDQVFELGWPGQTAVGASAAHRVYTAIRELRRCGLGEALQTHAEGYLLDPGHPIEVMTAAS